MASKLGLHLVPDLVRGADGTLASTRNPLDILVNLPVAQRTPTAHLRALCAELSAASGVNITFVGPAAYPLEQIYMPGGHFGRRGSREDLTVPWGADGVPAREALVNLLVPSATTLRWHLICRTDKSCFIQVGPIQFITQKPGGTVATELLYDHCTICPNVIHPPTPSIQK
jgi:hypothetical protein